MILLYVSYIFIITFHEIFSTLFNLFYPILFSYNFTAYSSTSFHYQFYHFTFPHFILRPIIIFPTSPSFHVFIDLTFRGSLLNFQLSFLNFQRIYRFLLFITIFLLSFYFRNSSISTKLCIVYHKDINIEHHLKTGRILILMICRTVC